MDWTLMTTVAGDWILQTTWQVTVLVVVIATLQRIFRRWMSPQARYAMWMLVAVRLAIPLLPASPWSIYNLLSRPQSSVASSAMPGTEGRWTVSVSVETPEKRRVALPSLQQPAVDATSPWGWQQTITVVWLAVAGVLGMRMLVQMRRIRRIVAEAGDANVGDLLSRCQQVLHLQRNIRVLESSAVRSPAVFGLLRVSILLPEGLAGQLTPEQLRLVILHELVHIRRLDHWTHRALLILQIIHWFNPAVYFAFSRCQLEREMACDEAVLRHTGAWQSEVYGQTLLDLSARIPQSAALMQVPAMAEGKQQLRRRIQMIASGSTTYRRSALLAGFVIAVTATVFITRAQLRSPAIGETGKIVTPQATAAKPDAAPDANKLVNAALDKLLPELKLDGAQLADAVEFLRDISGANIFVNWKSLEAAGVNSNTPIAIKLTNVTCRKALSTVLDAASISPTARLVFQVQDGVITISTAESMEGPAVARVYDVSDLLIYGDSDSKTPADIEAMKKQVSEEIATLVRQSVMVDKWKDNNPAGKGTVRPSPNNQQLIITQTPAVHEHVQSLLDQLRETKGIQVTVECCFICLDPAELPASVRRLLEQSIGQSHAAYLSSEQVSELLKLTQKAPLGSLITAPRMTVYNGRAARVEKMTSTSYVSAFTVGIDAKGQAEYRPVVSTAAQGITLSLRATTSADRKYVTVYVHPQLSQLASLETIPWPGNAAAGQNLTVQKPRIETSELETLASVPDSGTLLLGGLAEVRMDGGTTLPSRMDGGTTLLRQPTTTATKGQQPNADGKWLPVFMLVKPIIIIQPQVAHQPYPVLPDHTAAQP